MSTSIVARLKDFPDRLPPMLVKELRQGLRARSFVAIFLILKGLLALILLTAVAAHGGSNVGGVVSGIIFFFMTLALLVFQPLRGIAALSSEMKANTMEIMTLTRLSAWRITVGKWSALVSQSALLVAAVIPYLILRYFLGGMQLFTELVILAVIFVLSATATAVTVGISANRGLLLRALVPIIMIPLGMYGAIAAIFASSYSGFGGFLEIFSLSTPESRATISILVFFAIYVGWLALDFGASMIAPISENRATFRRIVGLFLAAVLIAVTLIFNDELLPPLGLVFIAPLLLISLAEPMNLTTSVVSQFTRRGLPGRIAGRLLYPGWASGTFFSILLVGMFAAAVILTGNTRYDDELMIVTYTIVGGLMFPAAALALFGKRVTNRFAAYLIILASSAILTAILSFISATMNQELLLYLFLWLPPVALPIWGEVGESTAAAISATGLAAYTLILAATAVIAMRQASALERLTTTQPDPQPDPDA